MRNCKHLEVLAGFSRISRLRDFVASTYSNVKGSWSLDFEEAPHVV